MTDTPQQPTPEPQQPAEPAQQLAPPPAKPDLTMAWLPHLLMVLTGFLGPLIIWLIKKDESKLAAFHGKQAFIFGLVPLGLLVVGAILSWVPVLGCCVIVVVLLALLGCLAYGIVGTVSAGQGKPFKYKVVADQFCAKEFAEAYPAEAAKAAQQAPQQPQEPQQQPPQQQ